MFKSIAIAISFLTCLPINPGKVDETDMLRAVSWFPLAGVVLGGLVASLVWAGMWLGLPSLVLAVWATGFLAWLTRGLHLDGVADLADGFGGSLEPLRRLEIMKDSATGAFGVVALILLLLFKVACFYYLFDCGLPGLVVVLMVPVVARYWMVVTAAGASYPRDCGTGHFIIGQVSGGQVLLGLVFVLPFLAFGLQSVAVLVCAGIPACFLRLRANKLLGGVTGDVLGAVTEWSEAFGLLGGLLYLGSVLV